MRSWIQIAAMGPLHAGLLSGSPPETPACARMWYSGANLRGPVHVISFTMPASVVPSPLESASVGGGGATSVMAASLMGAGASLMAAASVTLPARELSGAPASMPEIDVLATPPTTPRHGFSPSPAK